MGSIWSDAAQISPAHSSNAAIIVSLALKAGSSERQRRKIGNRFRRQQRHRDALIARGAASDPRNSGDQNVSTLGESNVAQN